MPLSRVAGVLAACSEIQPTPDPFNDLSTWPYDFFFHTETVSMWAAYANMSVISEHDVVGLRRLFAEAGMSEPFLLTVTSESAHQLWEALRRFPPPTPNEKSPSQSGADASDWPTAGAKESDVLTTNRGRRTHHTSDSRSPGPTRKRGVSKHVRNG